MFQFLSPCTNFDGRILENHQREHKESYETQVEGLTLKVDHLQYENKKLQNLFQEKSDINENIRQELSRFSSENSVCYISLSLYICIYLIIRCRTNHVLCLSLFDGVQVIPELKLQISELQRQKQELEIHAEEQNRELAGTIFLYMYVVFLSNNVQAASNVFIFSMSLERKNR